MVDKERISQKMKVHDYRLTPQREVILDVMLDNQGQHLSADQVLLKARRKNANIGIATVYRTLDKLADIQILQKTMFDEKYRYEFFDDTRHRHHHIICLKCGAIAEIQEDLLHQIELHVTEQGYEIVNHELKFYGYCPQCRWSVKGTGG